MRSLGASRAVNNAAKQGNAAWWPNRVDRTIGARGIIWAEDFLFAGSSTLLLLLAGLWPDFWFLSLLALVPFLHRAIRANPIQALRLGSLLGLSYFAVLLAGPLYATPAQTIFRLVAGTSLCAAFGWTNAIARRRLGFNPFFTALLWVAFELTLIRAGFAHGLLAELDVGSGFLYRSGILFGFLAISFIIVLINTIVVEAIETAISMAKARGTVYPESERTWDPFLIPGLVAQSLSLAAKGRGPPERALRSKKPCYGKSHCTSINRKETL